MNRRLAALLLATALAPLAGCAHLGGGRRVAAVDPAPFLASLRAGSLPGGLSAEADLAYRGGGRRFEGTAYLLTDGDGRFRVEVPGAWGSTLLVLVSDGSDLWAYYPGQGVAYHGSLVDGVALDRLPFPLPAEPARLPSILAGALPPDVDPASARAFGLANGQVELVAPADGGEVRFRFSSTRDADPALLEAAFHGLHGSVTVAFSELEPFHPSSFVSRTRDGTLRGTLTSVRAIQGPPGTPFGPPHPPGVEVRDLGGLR